MTRVLMIRSSLVARFLVAIAVVVLGLIGTVLRSEEQPGGGEQVEALVKELAAEEFAVREAATRRLWELGDAALPALREACGSDEPETSIRARRIVADLELGIRVDTPPETVALIREFHAGGLAERENVLRRLRGDDQLLVRIQLLLSEKNPEWRDKLVREFAGTGDVILEALRKSGQLEQAENLLAILSPRSWAVHLLLEEKAEASLARLTAKWDQGKGSVDPAQLFWLLVVTDKLAEARGVAEQSGQAGLQREVYLRQGAWKELTEVEGEEVGSNPIEKLGFKAWFHSKAGDEAGAQAAIDELVGLEIKDDRMARDRAAAFLLLGRFDLAETSFAQQEAVDVNEFSFHVERFQFEKLARRLGMDPAAGAGEGIRKRIEKALKEENGTVDRNARRELFYLCRRIGELLAEVGEKEEAKEVFLASVKLAGEESHYLFSLASSCRRAGLVEEAKTIELESLESGGVSYCLSGRFPGNRAMAQFWWDFLRDQHGDEPMSETLRRVEDLMKSAEGDGEDAAAPMAEVLKWVEKQARDERAKLYGVLGNRSQAERDWEAATGWFRKQSELSKEPAAPLIEAGDMFAAEERWDEAAAFYREAAEVDSGDELAVYLHGRALVAGGEREEGEARQAAAFRLPLANSQRRNTFAYALLRRGLNEAAEEQWRWIVKTAAHDDFNGMAFWALRTARMRMVATVEKENPALAADFLEGYLMSFLKTNTSSTARNYLIYTARIEALRFEACLAEGKVEDAILHVRRALAAWPGTTRLVIKAGELLPETGHGEVADELYESVRQRYEGVLVRFPRSAKYHNSLAWLAGRSGRDLDRALTHAETAVKFDPEKPEYLDTLAEVHFRRGDRDKAIALAKRCLELEPDAEQYQDQLERFEAD